MYCEKCGKEIPEGSSFCPECGFQLEKNEIVKTSGDKNMILALVISFILTGLGIVYAGNKKKGILLFVVGLIFNLIGRAVPVCAAVGIIIWVYALYETYKQVKIANGENDPNLIEDIKGLPRGKKIGSIIVIVLIFLMVIGGIIAAFTPHETVTTYDDYDSYSDGIDTDTVSSSPSDSSDSGNSYSSSSNGHDVSSHYEGEHGSSDTHGTVYDDGSVESHQTGHTDYGDYQIDSYMDSDGNLHGKVDVGGKTYYVDN